MDNTEDFEAIFGSNPNVVYDEETRRKIHHNRKSLEDELFIDRLLTALGITKVSTFYPPGSNQKLRNLHYEIASSPSPDHHKHAVLYYLLRDISHSSRRSPEKFAARSYLPAKYKTFIDGIWYLDRLKLEKALDYLTEPGLIPTFPDEILHILCRHAQENDVTLPVAYYHSVSPTITSSRTLKAYFLILCRASITEAFHFARAQSSSNHRTYFETLITFVHADSRGVLKAKRGVELINLPFSEEENDWFTAYLEGEGDRLPGAADTLRMREIASGSPESIQKRKLKSSETIDGLSWDTLEVIRAKG